MTGTLLDGTPFKAEDRVILVGGWGGPPELDRQRPGDRVRPGNRRPGGRPEVDTLQPRLDGHQDETGH